MIPSARETLDDQLSRALAYWRTSHGRARADARYELHNVIWNLRKELHRADAAFRAAVARSKTQTQGTRT